MNKYIKNIMDKNKKNPVFIIVIGPSGSGKNHIESTYLNFLRSKINDFTGVVNYFRIDDVIENDKEYIKNNYKYSKNKLLINE